MADRKFTTQEIRDLIASLNAAGLDEMAGKVEKRLEKGQQLTRNMLKAIDSVRKAENKMYQEKLKQMKVLEANEHRLNDRQNIKLKALRSEVKELERNAKVIDTVTKAQNESVKTTERGNQAHSKTPKILRDAGESLSRYTSSLGLLDVAIEGLTALYDNWFSIQREITQGMGDLARQTGGTSQQLREFRVGADRMRDTMTRIGGSLTGWAEGFEFVSSTAIALRTDMSGMAEEFQMELLAAQRGLGMSAEQAAALVRTLETGIEGGNESLGDFVIGIREFAAEIGANASTMAQDFLDSRDALQRFGQDGGQVFRDTATFANQLGFETRRILDMAAQFNRFGQASEHMNQLNAMFGTTISSLELMQEDNPVRRIEMITNAIREQGSEWSTMTFAQQDALAAAMGVSQSEAARLMNGETMEQIQAEQARRQEEQARAAERQATAQETIYDIIIQTSTAFRGWREYLQMIINDVSEVLNPIFQAIHGSSEGTMNAIRGWVQRIAQNPDFKRTIENIADWLEDMPKHIERFAPTWEEIRDTAQEIWPIVRDLGSMLLEIIQFAVEHPEAIAIALGVAAAIRLGGALSSALATVQAITAAGPAMTAGFAGLAGALAPLAAVGGAWTLANMAEDRRISEGQAVSNRDMGTLGRLQGTAEQELRRRAHRQSQGMSGSQLNGGDDFFTNLGEGLGIVSGQEGDQRRGRIENVIDDFIRPGNKNPANATRELLGILGPELAGQVAERNGASSFEEFVRSRFMQDTHLRDAFWQTLGLSPPGGDDVSATSAATGSVTATSAVDSAPATAGTTSAPSSTASVGGVEIVAADVILDGNRVGQAIFNISRR